MSKAEKHRALVRMHLERWKDSGRAKWKDGGRMETHTVMQNAILFGVEKLREKKEAIRDRTSQNHRLVRGYIKALQHCATRVPKDPPHGAIQFAPTEISGVVDSVKAIQQDLLTLSDSITCAYSCTSRDAEVLIGDCYAHAFRKLFYAAKFIEETLEPCDILCREVYGEYIEQRLNGAPQIYEYVSLRS